MRVGPQWAACSQEEGMSLGHPHQFLVYSLVACPLCLAGTEGEEAALGI